MIYIPNGFLSCVVYTLGRHQISKIRIMPLKKKKRPHWPYSLVIIGKFMSISRFRRRRGSSARECPPFSTSDLRQTSSRLLSGYFRTQLCQALADGLQHRVVFDVVLVVGLQFGGDAVERALQGLLRRGVHHLGLCKG